MIGVWAPLERIVIYSTLALCEAKKGGGAGYYIILLVSSTESFSVGFLEFYKGYVSRILKRATFWTLGNTCIHTSTRDRPAACRAVGPEGPSSGNQGKKNGPSWPPRNLA